MPSLNENHYFLGENLYSIDLHLANLEPLSHLQQSLFKGRQDASISRGSNIQQKVTVATDSGDKLVDQFSGVEEHVHSFSAVVAPRTMLDGVAALPLVGNHVTWAKPVQ